MISIRNTVGLFLLFVSFIISLNSAAAVPVTIDYTLTKPSTADILPGYQTFDSGDDCLIWTHPLYFGAIIFDLCVLDLSALQSNGSGGLGYELTTLMNDEADWILNAKVSIGLPASMSREMIGGHIVHSSFTSGFFSADPYNSVTSVLYADTQQLSGSAIQYANLQSCGQDCLMGNFGNGSANLPAPPISNEISVVHNIQMAPTGFGYISANLDLNNTQTCPDLNGDNTVDSADLSILLGSYGTNNTGLELTLDTLINGEDLGRLLGEFGACS